MKRKVRRRRSAEEAQAAILDAAEQQLAARGPDGIRLQELADALDLSHPAILHHFGSRAGLVRAVVARTTARLEQELIAIISAGVDQEGATHVLERVLEVLADRKHARTLAWLYLTEGVDDLRGTDPLGHGGQLKRISDVVHTLRRQHLGKAVPYWDTLYTVTLASLALFGQAVAGPEIQAGAGVERKPFLRWFTGLLLGHLDGPELPR
jgi:TetR/AcrR family transcriptional regulator, repressor for neighboring sulfatase